MTRFDALERDLTVWFDETAMPRRPDYTTEIIQSTAAMPQRRWMAIERWFPMNVVEFRRRTFPPFPWRTAAVLIALVALLVAGLVYVGSQPRLPPPFGLAGNGLVAYSKDGDIFTVDPGTGERRWVTSGDDVDAVARWAPDGTRLAFLRGPSFADAGAISQSLWRVMIVDGQRNVLAESIPIHGIDPDAFAWSPDGRYIAVGGAGNTISIVDTADGGIRPLDVVYGGLDLYWRPDHPTELLVRGATKEGSGLVLVDVDRPGSARLVAADAEDYLRPSGWTPDGRRIVYTRRDQGVDGSAPAETRILDLTTGAFVDIEAGYADISNDGTRIVAIDHDGRPCIASIDGGPCIAIADSAHAFDGTFAGGTFWAPDDRSIVGTISADVPPAMRDLLLLDPEGRGIGAPAAWMADGAESWQRVAP
jgi:dipeptidyl aminopeptidase/acylaminoacyl peptidase